MTMPSNRTHPPTHVEFDRSVTVIIPTIPIPIRRAMMKEAVGSVLRQNVMPDSLLVGADTKAEGPSVVRNRLTASATTEWVAYLDDDDMFLPEHLATLLDAAERTGADLIYPWFEIRSKNWEPHTAPDPLFVNGKPAFKHPFNDDAEMWLLSSGNFIPVTVLVRRELVMDVGGWPEMNSESWPHDCCEDWGLWQRLLRAGAKFHHVPKKTWWWRWSGHNTSGKPSRWNTGVRGA